MPSYDFENYTKNAIQAADAATKEKDLRRSQLLIQQGLATQGGTQMDLTKQQGTNSANVANIQTGGQGIMANLHNAQAAHYQADADMLPTKQSLGTAKANLDDAQAANIGLINKQTQLEMDAASPLMHEVVSTRLGAEVANNQLVSASSGRKQLDIKDYIAKKFDASNSPVDTIGDALKYEVDPQMQPAHKPVNKRKPILTSILENWPQP